MNSSSSKRLLLCLLIQTIPSMQAGQRYGRQRISKQGIGQSLQPLANLRFGSFFRNSIPPVRPYNPPTFEDIFETDHSSENNGRMFKDPQKSSSQPDPQFGKESKKQQNVLKVSNESDEIIEIDGNSDSVKSSNKASESLDKVKEKTKQILFGKETFKKPFGYTKDSIIHNVKNVKNVIMTERNTNSESTTIKFREDSEKELHLNKAIQTETPLDTQRLYSTYKHAQHTENEVKKTNRNIQGKTTMPEINSELNETGNKVNKLHQDFHGIKYQTSFNLADYGKENGSTRIRVKVNSDKAVEKSEKQKSYEAKLARWQQKKAKLLQTNRKMFIDKSIDNVVKDARVEEVITRPSATDTTTTIKTIFPIKEEDIILTEIEDEREIVNMIENYVDKDVGNVFKENEYEDNPFTEALCEKLRVPCRFVTEHPCCKFPQSIELVGRARGMDGSADLRWRFLENRQSEAVSNHYVRLDDNGGPRQGPQGRMITGFAGQSSFQRPNSFTIKSTKNNIIYNHAVSKENVIVPHYHYGGGPQLTKMILQQCWRLNYLDCQLELDHPCCALKSNKPVDSLSSNVLDKWLR